MSETGNLKDQPLATLLTGFAARKTSGVVRLRQGTPEGVQRGEIVLLEGKMIGAALYRAGGVRGMGDALVDEALCSPEDAAAAADYAVQVHPPIAGTLKEGASRVGVPYERVAAVLREHIKGVVRVLWGWRSGQWELFLVGFPDQADRDSASARAFLLDEGMSVADLGAMPPPPKPGNTGTFAAVKATDTPTGPRPAVTPPVAPPVAAKPPVPPPVSTKPSAPPPAAVKPPAPPKPPPVPVRPPDAVSMQTAPTKTVLSKTAGSSEPTLPPIPKPPMPPPEDPTPAETAAEPPELVPPPELLAEPLPEVEPEPVFTFAKPPESPPPDLDPFEPSIPPAEPPEEMPEPISIFSPPESAAALSEETTPPEEKPAEPASDEPPMSFQAPPVSDPFVNAPVAEDFEPTIVPDSPPHLSNGNGAAHADGGNGVADAVELPEEPEADAEPEPEDDRPDADLPPDVDLSAPGFGESAMLEADALLDGDVLQVMLEMGTSAAQVAALEAEKICTGQVVIIDADGSLAQVLLPPLREAGYVVHALIAGPESRERLTDVSEDGQRPLVVCDLLIKREDGGGMLGGLDIAAHCGELVPSLPVLLLAETSDAEIEDRAKKADVKQVLPRPSKTELKTDVAARNAFVDELLLAIDEHRPRAEWAVSSGEHAVIDVTGTGGWDVEGIQRHAATVEDLPDLPEDPAARQEALWRETVRQLSGPVSQPEILLQILRFGAEVMARGVLFTPTKKGDLKGFGQFGVDLGDGVDPDDAVRKIKMPADGHPAVQAAVANRGAVRHIPGSTHWEQQLLDALGGGVPREGFFGPVFCQGKLVALLYGDMIGETEGEGIIPESTSLEVVLGQAGLAMDRAELEARVRALEGKE